MEHHYHFDIFNATIDFQLQELDCRFGKRVMELLTLNENFDKVCIQSDEFTMKQ